VLEGDNMPLQSRYSAIVLVGIGLLTGLIVATQWDRTPTQPVFGTPNFANPNESLPAKDQEIRTLADLNRAFVELAKSVNPSVVTVFTERVYRVPQDRMFPFFRSPFEDFFEDFFGRRQPRQQEPEEREYRRSGLGSGVIVSTDGYIITNNHVIENSDTIRVTLIDRRTFPATVVGSDPQTDIAILKIEANDLPAISLGNSDALEIGEWVLAIGSPFSADLAHTVTSGIVSAKGRSGVGLAEYEDFIQTDAAINPGNSGGALVNMNGELVGINSAIATRTGGFQGIGFAVPINMARRVMESLLAHGEVIRGYLGVIIQDIDDIMAQALELPVTEGALVSDVQDGSPAENAGIRQGDVIIKLDGKNILSTSQLRNEIASRPPDTVVNLTIIRDGREQTIDVRLAKLEPEDLAAVQPDTEIDQLLGFRVTGLTDENASRYGIDRSRAGVVVTEVQRNSTAARQGLREGDLITHVNRQQVQNVNQFYENVRGMQRGDTILLNVTRENSNIFLAFPL
jgi:serine protease Do